MVFFNPKAKTAPPTALIMLLFSIISLSLGTELCDANGNPIDPSSTAISPTVTRIPGSSYCVQYFTIDLNIITYKGKYVLIELKLDDIPDGTNKNYFDPSLIGRLGSKPIIDSTSYTNSQFHQIDQNGYFFRKNYQHIELHPDDTRNGGIYYVALYRNFTTNYYAQSISYTIKATSNETYLCPRSCSGNGVCKPNENRCQCNPGYFDTDCSVSATLISAPGGESTTVLPRNWTYFYFPGQDINDNVQLNILGNKQEVKAYYMFNTTDFNNISLLASTDAHIIQPNNPYGITWTDSSDDDSDDGENIIWILGIQNSNGDNSVTINYEAILLTNSNSPNVVMTIIISVLAFFIAITILVIICKLRQLKKLRLRAEQIQIAQAQTQATPQFLTIEQIDLYFPKNLYRRTRNHFQSSCSVCLEDFQPDSSCRRLYCGHVYHDACIEEWLRKHDKCPNCNKEMTLAAINEFIKNPFILSPNLKIQSRTFDFRHVPQTTNRLQTQPTSPILSPGTIQYQRQRQETQDQDQERAEIQRNHNRTTSIDPLVHEQTLRQRSFDLHPIVVRVGTSNEAFNGNQAADKN